MSIEALLNAAKYLECESGTTSKPQLSGSLGSGIIDNQKASSGHQSKKIESLSAKEQTQDNITSADVEQTVNPLNNIMLERRDKEVVVVKAPHHTMTDRNPPATTLNVLSNEQIKKPSEEASLLAISTPLESTRTLFPNVTFVDSVSKTSHMNPLFARARAAVESIQFSRENVCTLRRPVEIETSNAPLVVTRPVHMTLSGNHGVGVLGNPNSKQGLLSVPLNPQQWMHSDPRISGNEIMPVQSSHIGIQPQMDLNRLLPSLVKSSDDEKTLSTLQLKQVKRGATLTHNQLEKNRRAHLKECFEALKTSIPRLGMRRSSNLTILKAALRHIQILKRKSSEWQQTLIQLKKDKEEKEAHAAALIESLSNTSSKEQIEKYLEEEVKKEIDNSRSNRLLDDSQLSTSTASEAEEEEFRASLNASNEDSDKQSYKNNHLSYRPPETVSFQAQCLHVKGPELSHKSPDRVSPHMLQCKDTHGPGQLDTHQPNAGAQPKYQLIHQNLPEENWPYDTTQPQETTKLHVVLPQRSLSRSDIANKIASSVPNVKKSPVKLYGQPSGRSATPSPPSNVRHFFPQFSIGSRGSPPLLTTTHDPLERLTKSRIRSQESAVSSSTSTSDKHFRPVLGEISPLSSQPSRSVASPLPSVATSTSTYKMSTSAFSISNSCANKTSLAIPSSSGVAFPDNIVLPRPPVSLPSYSGYEVKVKYLNPSSSLTSVMSSVIDQTHIPMKKRHLDANTFASVSSNPSVEVSSSSKPSMRSDSTLQMTSLYVGASAALLGQTSSTRGLGSSSDNESDRDTQFRDPKRGKIHHHWRKNLVNERSGWTEHRPKPAEKNTKKKPLQLHQYEAPQAKSVISSSVKPSADTKPKATFSLWDRKHHAITMTTATNWRGKQQQHLLAVTKSKFTAVSTSPCEAKSIQQLPISPVTRVSYSVSASKPAVPTSLVVGKTQEKSPQAVALEPEKTKPSASVSPVLKLSQGSATAYVNGLASNTAIGAVPVHLPENQVSYRMVSPSGAFQTSVATPSVASTTPHNPVLASPLVNYVTYNGAGQQVVGAASHRGILPVSAIASSTPPATVQQANPVQMPLMMPTVIPVHYVMVPGANPGGVVHNGLQMTGLSPQANTLAPGGHMPLQLQPTLQAPPKVGIKRPASPTKLFRQPPTRTKSTDSSSSSTLSVDSVDVDNMKEGTSPPKKRSLCNRPTQHPQNDVPPSVTPRQVAHLPQQFVMPGNPSFFMAAPTSGNSYTMPLQLLSYPLQGHPGGGYIQTVQMPGMLPPQAGRNVGQMWSMGQTVLPHCETPVTMTTSSSANQHVNVSPVMLQRVRHVSQ